MRKIRGYTCLHFVVSNYNLRANLSLALLCPHVGAQGGALVYLPYWSMRENPALSFLLEQEVELCCILPVGVGGKALLYPPC